MDRQFGPIRFISGENSGKYPHCHSLYIEADRKTLIDPASDRKKLRELRDGPGVDAVWLSHWHEDHLMSLDLFEDCELRVSEPDAKPLESLESFFDAYGLDESERAMWTKIMVEQFHFKPRRPDRFLNDGEIIDLGGVTVEVILTPGHTPGHCSFLFPDAAVLAMGDYDLSPFGPWYGDVDSDIDQIVESVGKLRSIEPRVWIVSHETGVYESDPGDLWDAFLAVIDTREAKLLDLLKEPRTMPEIVDAHIVYGRKREPKELFDFGERALMGKHLERLMKKGTVRQENDRFNLV